MGRALGGWLEGPGLPRDTPPGARLGLPADGPGSVVGFGPRIIAYIVDGVLANLLVGLLFVVGVDAAADIRGLAIYGAFLLEELVLVTVAGQTIGMRLAGIRVIRVRDFGRQSWPWILVRTLLLALLVPAFIWDRDLRGTHDRAAGTVVVRDEIVPSKA
ncbi:RDD family protein [Parafrankia irregularis]|uniref:RDD family protein n=1 Tax=Parafrankia irregularis TaxID=795642 RepID=A0A0S4QWR3_9ACTN|nr:MULTISPECIES: RDD family protein [Frankiaceae]CUU60112.1 RDD family protein [Parafrankia irregularis]